jgi:hypothetical protein
MTNTSGDSTSFSLNSGSAAGSNATAPDTSSPNASGSAGNNGATVNATVDNEATADAVAGGAFFSAIALILGAIAACVGGRAGTVDPTVTDYSIRHPIH